MIPPCKRDCPGRSPTCHTVCEKYKAYQQVMASERELRAGERDAISAQYEGTKRRTGYYPQK